MMGSKERTEYTALGSPVNLASRLQGKSQKGRVLIDERTYRLLASSLDVRPLGMMELKHLPSTPVYEVLRVRTNTS